MESLVKLASSIAIACGVCVGGIANAIGDMQYRSALEDGSLYVLIDQNGKPVSQER